MPKRIEVVLKLWEITRGYELFLDGATVKRVSKAQKINYLSIFSFNCSSINLIIILFLFPEPKKSNHDDQSVGRTGKLHLYYYLNKKPIR